MIGPHLLGWNREHDPLSRNYASALKAVQLYAVTHTLSAPHLNQADLGSCEGNTAAEFLNCAIAYRNRISYNQFVHRPRVNYLTERNAVDLYSVATANDNDDIPGQYPPTDTGTSGVGIAKAMQLGHAIERYDWTFTWNAFLAALQHQPIMLGINWYESMFDDPKNNGGLVRAPAASDDPAGGHAILAYAYSPLREAVGCTNHWVNDDGTPWGVRIGRHSGSFWIANSLLNRLLIHEQGESLVPVLL